MKFIRYRDGYAYQLAVDYEINVPILPDREVEEAFIKLDRAGNLRILDGYAWDGPSGPALDTPNFMRGSLVHDALYQLLRDELIPQRYRQVADNVLRQLCREDGMSGFRAWYTYHAVRIFAKDAADPASRKPILQAPRSAGEMPGYTDQNGSGAAQ